MDISYRTTLELDKIIARATELCACRETKEMMQAIQPCQTPEDERWALAQTDVVNSLLIKNGSPRFGAVSDARRIAAHAVKGGILSMERKTIYSDSVSSIMILIISYITQIIT